MREAELIHEAVARLNALPEVRVTTELSMKVKDQTVDALLHLHTPTGEQQYVVEAKRRLTPSILDVVISQATTLTAMLKESGVARKGTESIRPLIVTDYVTPPVADKLLERDIEFIDAAGNAYLNSPAAYIAVRGKKRPDMPARHDAFTAIGLKIAYAVLREPSLLERTYREISSVARVSLGSVSNTLRALLTEGYLTRGSSGSLHLTAPRRLRERWELGYAEQLRPALDPSAWRLTRGDLADLTGERTDVPVTIGGEVGAEMLGLPLRPQTASLYLPSEQHKAFAVSRRLKPAEADAQAQVYLLDELAGATPGDPGASRVADPLLVRAELLALGGDRLRAIADRIRDEMLPGGADG